MIRDHFWALLSFTFLFYSNTLSAQDTERTSGKITDDFDGTIGFSYGAVIPLGSFASTDDTINSGFAQVGGAFAAGVSFFRPGRRLGLNLRYSYVDIDFHSEELFQVWSISFPEITFEPRSSAWKVHAPSASLVYRMPIMQNNASFTFGAGVGIHRYTRPKVVVNYREYYSWGDVPWSWVQDEINGVAVSVNALCTFTYHLTSKFGADLTAEYQYSNVEMKVRNEYETLYLRDMIFYHNWYVQHAIQFVHLRAGLHYAF